MRQFAIRQFKGRQFRNRQFDVTAAPPVSGGGGTITLEGARGGDGGKIPFLHDHDYIEAQNDEAMTLIVLALADDW